MNTDFRVSINLLRHQKGRKLRRKLGMAGIGHLIGLWAFFSEFYPKGIAPRSEDTIADIEDAAFWEGEPGTLVATLVEIGFVDMDDEFIAVHDWEEHNAYAAGAEERSESARKAAQAKWKRNIHAQPMHPASDPQPIRSAEIMRPASDPQCDPQQTRSADPLRQECDPQPIRNAPFPSPSPSPSPFPFPSPDPEPAPATTTEPASVPTPEPEPPQKEKKGEGDLIHNDYTPKPETLAIIESTFGIPADFIAAQIPLFILHHQEAGSRRLGFESLFVGWVRKAWNVRPPAQELACAASGRRKGQTHIEKLMEDHVRLFGPHPAPDPFAPSPAAALIEGSVEHVH